MHKSLFSMYVVRDCVFELVDRPPYFPNLAPSYYHLFLNMINQLAENKNRSDNGIISADNDFFHQASSLMGSKHYKVEYIKKINLIWLDSMKEFWSVYATVSQPSYV